MEVSWMLTIDKQGKFINNFESRFIYYSQGMSISTSPKQINTLGIGTFIKIVFTKPPPKTNKNPNG